VCPGRRSHIRDYPAAAASGEDSMRPRYGRFHIRCHLGIIRQFSRGMATLNWRVLDSSASRRSAAGSIVSICYCFILQCIWYKGLARVSFLVAQADS